jgi:methionyl-tRNA formyltransferase
MKVVFIGGTKRGYLTVKALLDCGAQLGGIISLLQDPHETARYEEPIKDLARTHGIPHYETKALKDRDYADLLRTEIRADVGFVVGCRVLLPEDIYRVPPLGMFAVHDSLLPEYRGFAPLNWAVINGETRTGVTLFRLDERMDGGDIAKQRAVEIGRTETAAEVYERVCGATVEVVRDAHRDLLGGKLTTTPQDYSMGSFTCSRIPEDGLIDWSASTQAIFDRVRGLSRPYPGAYTFYQNARLIIWSAELGPMRRYAGRIPGRVITVAEPEGYVDVLTGDGILRLLEVQQDGEVASPAAKIVRSVKTSLGMTLSQLLARVTELEREVRSSRIAAELSATSKGIPAGSSGLT